MCIPSVLSCRAISLALKNMLEVKQGKLGRILFLCLFLHSGTWQTVGSHSRHANTEGRQLLNAVKEMAHPSAAVWLRVAADLNRMPNSCKFSNTTVFLVQKHKLLPDTPGNWARIQQSQEWNRQKQYPFLHFISEDDFFFLLLLLSVLFSNLKNLASTEKTWGLVQV